jgi:hypothetical protein
MRTPSCNCRGGLAEKVRPNGVAILNFWIESAGGSTTYLRVERSLLSARSRRVSESTTTAIWRLSSSTAAVSSTLPAYTAGGNSVIRQWRELVLRFGGRRRYPEYLPINAALTCYAQHDQEVPAHRVYRLIRGCPGWRFTVKCVTLAPDFTPCARRRIRCSAAKWLRLAQERY